MDFANRLAQFGDHLAELGFDEPIEIKVGRHDFEIVREAYAPLAKYSASAANALWVEGRIRVQLPCGEAVIIERRD